MAGGAWSGRGCLVGEGVPGRGGGAWSGGYLPGPGVVPGPGGAWSGGYLFGPGGGVVSKHALRQTPPL